MSDRSHKFRKYEDLNKSNRTFDETNGMLEDYDIYLIEPFDVGGAIGGAVGGVGDAVGGAVGGVGSAVGDIASGVGSGVSSVLSSYFKGVSDLMSGLSTPLLIGMAVAALVVIGLILWAIFGGDDKQPQPQ